MVHGCALPVPHSGCSNSSLMTPRVSNKAPSLPLVSFSLRFCLELAQTLVPKNNPGASPSRGRQDSCAGKGMAETSLVFVAHFGHLWHLSGTKFTRFPHLSSFCLLSQAHSCPSKTSSLEAPKVFLAQLPVERGTDKGVKVAKNTGSFHPFATCLGMT